jgi:hypothetical protein
MAYFSLIHDNWAFEFNEDWRFHYPDGSVPKGRYVLVCLNSPYRDYVLGVRIKGVKNHTIFYLTPTDAAAKKAVWPQDHVSHRGTQAQVEVLPGSEVLGRIPLPFVGPAVGRNIGSRFAAIHSNPPALQPGTEPAIVQHRFGKG